MDTVDKKLKVGVVGLGKMGLLHASLLSVMPNVNSLRYVTRAGLCGNLQKAHLKDL